MSAASLSTFRSDAPSCAINASWPLHPASYCGVVVVLVSARHYGPAVVAVLVDAKHRYGWLFGVAEVIAVLGHAGALFVEAVGQRKRVLVCTLAAAIPSRRTDRADGTDTLVGAIGHARFSGHRSSTLRAITAGISAQASLIRASSMSLSLYSGHASSQSCILSPSTSISIWTRITGVASAVIGLVPPAVRLPVYSPAA